MDAFAVSICKGISVKTRLNKKAVIVGMWFGVFQAIMPLIGYFFIDVIDKYIGDFKEYIVFALLCYVGVVMLFEANRDESLNDSVAFKDMLILAIATSLDALSVGATLSLFKINIFVCVSIIMVITFIFSYIGVIIGNRFGNKYKSKAEIAGGIILIIIGLKVLLEYLL
jgi:putative Mn2+ efflux pump MntP